MHALANLVNNIIYSNFYIKNPIKNYHMNLYVRFDIYDDGYQILFHSATLKDNNIVNCDLLDFIDIPNSLKEKEIIVILDVVKKGSKLIGYEELNNKIKLFYNIENKRYNNISYNKIIIDFSYFRVQEVKNIRKLIYKYIQNEITKEHATNNKKLVREKIQ